MNIRPVPGKLLTSDNPSFPYIGPFRKRLFLAVGMLVPAPDRRGLGTTKEHPSYAHRPASPRRDRRCRCRL